MRNTLSGFLALALTCSSLLSCVNEGGSTSAQEQKVTTAEASATQMAAIDGVTGYIDPVCTMKISAESTERHTHEGVTYGFCSAGCKKAFAQEPATYLAALEE